MKNTIRILMCLALALTMILGLIACSPKTATVTFDYSEWEDAECDEDERVLEIGAKIGKLPKPTLDGYKFKGWYTEEEYDLVTSGEDAEKAKTTLIVEEDITLYAHFEKDLASGDDSSGGGSSQTGSFDCAKGVHNWATATTEPTCTKAGTKVEECQICHKSNSDAIYSAQNPALGHQWVADGAIDDGGWTYVALARKRECHREGCDEAEIKQLQNITSNATITVSSDAGGWPALNEWSGILTDGIWEGKPNAAPRGGSPLTITILFNTPSEVDQIAMSVKGFGEDGYSSKFEIYLWYANEEDFREEMAVAGAFLETSGTRDGAICIDRTHDDGILQGIKIVMPKPLNGSEFYEEIALAIAPEEEE